MMRHTRLTFGQQQRVHAAPHNGCDGQGRQCLSDRPGAFRKCLQSLQLKLAIARFADGIGTDTDGDFALDFHMAQTPRNFSSVLLLSERQHELAEYTNG
eukprot:g15099.t1